MWEKIAKLTSFAAGLLLLILGTVQLYAGVSVAVTEEALVASTVSAFMVLFPGVVFLSYALRSMEPARPMRPVAGMLTARGGEPIAGAGDNVISFPSMKSDAVQARPAAGVQSK